MIASNGSMIGQECHVSQCKDLRQAHKTTPDRTHAQKGENIVVGAKNADTNAKN